MTNARLSRRSFALAAAALAAPVMLGRSAVAQDEGLSWRQITPNADGPAPRWDHTLAADDTGKQLLVFGGRDANFAAVGDSWLFDLADGVWTQVQGNAPSPRFGHAVAVDQEARILYLFGGQSADQFFNDAWAFDFDATSWELLHDGTGAAPSPRYGLGGVLDGAGRFIVSHGFTFEGRFDDTWAFDLESRSWTDVSPPGGGVRPLKRCLHEMVWDGDSSTMFLFGGCSSGFGPCPQGDLWSFDLSSQSWTEITPAAGPAARSNPAMVWHAGGKRAILTGGLADFGYTGDLWFGTTDDGFTWSEMTIDGDAPSPRSSHDLVVTGGRLYLFGGTSDAGVFNDLWRLRLPTS